MKTVAGGFVIAALCVAAAVVCLAEARLARRLASAHQRLATLRAETDDDLGDPGASPIGRITSLVGFDPADAERHRAIVRYWRGDYQQLTPLATATGPAVPGDTTVRLAAANAAFRASRLEAGARTATIERLDGVIQAYAGILRTDPTSGDAAFNFEYVARLRDDLARARGPAKSADQKSPDDRAAATADLPAGPTVLGRPGAPPQEIRMDEFKTVTPMRADERDQKKDPSTGVVRKRRG